MASRSHWDTLTMMLHNGHRANLLYLRVERDAEVDLLVGAHADAADRVHAVMLDTP